MKLSEKAITHLKQKAQRPTRLRLALQLDYSERWIERVVEANKPNGPLTTMAAIEILKESGLTDDEIFEAESVAA